MCAVGVPTQVEGWAGVSVSVSMSEVRLGGPPHLLTFAPCWESCAWCLAPPPPPRPGRPCLHWAFRGQLQARPTSLAVRHAAAQVSLQGRDWEALSVSPAAPHQQPWHLRVLTTSVCMWSWKAEVPG